MEERKIIYKESEKQKEVFGIISSGNYDFALLGGSIRAGKTYFLVALFIILCKVFPGSKYIIVRKTLARLKDTALPVFFELMPEDFTAKEPTASNGWEWVATNGSIIKFYAENIDRDPQLKRFRGLEADCFAFEEMDIQEKTFYVAFERTGTYKMQERRKRIQKGLAVPPAMVIGTSNPQGGWVKKTIYLPHLAGTLNKRWKYITFKVTDNPYLPEGWLERQKNNLTPNRYKMMIDGDWSINTNELPFFAEFDEDRHVVEKIDMYGMLDYYHEVPLDSSFDFNHSPCSFVCGIKVFGVGLFFFRSLQQNGGTEKLLRKKLQWLRDLDRWKTFTGDRNGHNIYSSAKQTDYDIIERFFEQTVSEVTYQANSQHTHSQAVCDQALFRIPCFFDGEDCAALIQEIKDAKPDSRGKLSKNPDLHLVDAWRYLMNLWFEDIDEVNAFADEIEDSQIEYLQFINQEEEGNYQPGEEQDQSHISQIEAPKGSSLFNI